MSKIQPMETIIKLIAVKGLTDPAPVDNPRAVSHRERRPGDETERSE